MAKSNGIRILGALMSQLHPSFVDASLLAAVQHLQEILSPFTHLNSLFFHHVVFEFDIWIKSASISVKIQVYNDGEICADTIADAIWNDARDIVFYLRSASAIHRHVDQRRPGIFST